VRNQAPEAVAEPIPTPSAPLAEKLRGITEAAGQRERERVAGGARVAARQKTAAHAMDQFELFWAQLARYVSTGVPNVRSTSGDGAWYLTLDDRRVVVQISTPGSDLCPAVQLGSVKVEAENGACSSEVANLSALLDSHGDPVWHLLRMVRNDYAPMRSPVSEALSDGYGAVSVHTLEEHYEEKKRRVTYERVTTHDSKLLDVEQFTELIIAEIDAIDRRLLGNN